MIQEICKDEKFLAQKAEQATPDDIQTATDLLETLEAHKDGCVGMAANMIGVNKRIIAFDNEGTYMETENLHRLDRTDYPARNRPLQRHHYLRKKQNVNQRIQKGTPNGVPFFCRSRKRRQRRTAVRRFNSLKKSYPVRKGRGNADGTRSDPPALRCWRPRGSCPCRAPSQSSR